MTTETKKIFKAMADIMQEVEAIAKDRDNISQKYKFRGIDDVYNALHPLFKKHRVFVAQKVLEDKREIMDKADGKKLIYSILKVEFKYYAEDGSFVESVASGEGMDSGDKATNKAMSAAQKYSLIQMFLIPTVDGSPDSDNDTHILASEFEKIEAEILRFTEADKLVKWAGDQGVWTKNDKFRAAVTAKRNALTKGGSNGN